MDTHRGHTEDPKPGPFCFLKRVPSLCPSVHPSLHFLPGLPYRNIRTHGMNELILRACGSGRTWKTHTSLVPWFPHMNPFVAFIKVPTPAYHQGLHSVFDGHRCSSSFLKRHDNARGLAWGGGARSVTSFHWKPLGRPRPSALLAASMANICPQSHVGAQTCEPFEPCEPCKQSGPLGMHVRIYRRVLCHRWHLFS